jgi:uncharacterized membrane-anchored protein YjiN (DUF445 family)
MDGFGPDQLKTKLSNLKKIKKDLTANIRDTNDYKRRVDVNKEIIELIEKLTNTPQDIAETNQTKPKTKKSKK